MARVIPILINARADGIDVNPTQVYVHKSSQDVKFRWTVAGGTFPGSGCFEWKDSPTGAPSVTCPSGGGTVLESATYQNEAGSGFGVWGYALTIVVDKPGGGTENVTIDPEINNEPPGN